ncbi:MAG: hypothetical protein F4Y68_10110 [Boseongicola sp. SB0665_bin_10]|nr:hypothetical protein [Boseongicola sp. SB0665_bin_10]
MNDCSFIFWPNPNCKPRGPSPRDNCASFALIAMARMFRNRAECPPDDVHENDPPNMSMKFADAQAVLACNPDDMSWRKRRRLPAPGVP